jgi:hypothetical protein
MKWQNKKLHFAFFSKFLHIFTVVILDILEVHGGKKNVQKEFEFPAEET